MKLQDINNNFEQKKSKIKICTLTINFWTSRKQSNYSGHYKVNVFGRKELNN